MTVFEERLLMGYVTSSILVCYTHQVIEVISAITLTEDRAVSLRACQTVKGTGHVAGDEWLLTHMTTTSYIPPIYVVS